MTHYHMSPLSKATVTRLLHELQNGNRAVLEDLFALVYDELHARAHRRRARWHRDYTLNTTALVHEAYLKLINHRRAQWNSRAHFFGVAAKAMHHILIDYARRKQAEIHGGKIQKLSLEEMRVDVEGALTPEPSEDHVEMLMALHKALRRLQQESEREAWVVECRVFGGMTVKETAEALGIGARTVKRDWAMALAWLRRELQEEGWR